MKKPRQNKVPRQNKETVFKVPRQNELTFQFPTTTTTHQSRKNYLRDQHLICSQTLIVEIQRKVELTFSVPARRHRSHHQQEAALQMFVRHPPNRGRNWIPLPSGQELIPFAALCAFSRMQVSQHLLLDPLTCIVTTEAQHLSLKQKVHSQIPGTAPWILQKRHQR